VRDALTILAKDLRLEWRTRESLASMVVLGILLLVVFTIAHDAPQSEAPALAPPVLWATFIFTGLLGVQRGFALERENDCLAGLLSSPIDPASIFIGKVLGNLILLTVMQAIVVPLVAVFLHVEVWGALPALALVLFLGSLGFAALATLFAAVASRTRAREIMLPLLLLPLLMPLLIASVGATREVLAGGFAGARDALTVLGAFDVIFAVAGWLLFEYVVRD
jgi:heme exporter protein B